MYDLTGIPSPMALGSMLRTWLKMHYTSLYHIATLCLYKDSRGVENIVRDGNLVLVFRVVAPEVGTWDGNPASLFRLLHISIITRDKEPFLDRSWDDLVAFRDQFNTMSRAKLAPGEPTQSFVGVIPALATNYGVPEVPRCALKTDDIPALAGFGKAAAE